MIQNDLYHHTCNIQYMLYNKLLNIKQEMIYKIFLSVLIILGGLLNIFDIDKERKPLTSLFVCLSIIFQILIVLGLWFFT